WLPGRAGGSPPGPPTDPDVRHARIRFLKPSRCYPCKDTLAPQSTGLLWSGLVSSASLPCVRPADALLDGAFPPVGRLGLTSPPSSVLCAATTATSPSRRASLGARRPDTLLASRVRGLPAGLRVWSKRPVHARAFGRPVPSSGCVTRSQVALPSSRVTPLDTCPALRPRWCPAHSPKRTQD